jgi:hypothetical protein
MLERIVCRNARMLDRLGDKDDPSAFVRLIAGDNRTDLRRLAQLMSCDIAGLSSKQCLSRKATLPRRRPGLLLAGGSDSGLAAERSAVCTEAEAPIWTAPLARGSGFAPGQVPRRSPRAHSSACRSHRRRLRPRCGGERKSPGLATSGVWWVVVLASVPRRRLAFATRR